jgi:hypothetical protein
LPPITAGSLVMRSSTIALNCTPAERPEFIRVLCGPARALELSGLVTVYGPNAAFGPAAVTDSLAASKRDWPLRPHGGAEEAHLFISGLSSGGQ